MRGLVILVLVAITGCEDSVSYQDRIVAAAVDTCQKLGYSPGTQQFSACAEREVVRYRQSNAAIAQNLMQRPNTIQNWPQMQ